MSGLSTTTQDVELNLSNLALLRLVGELRSNPSATYQIESTLFEAGTFARPQRATQTGTIDLRALVGSSIH